jgi:hypothetical protein
VGVGQQDSPDWPSESHAECGATHHDLRAAHPLPTLPEQGDKPFPGSDVPACDRLEGPGLKERAAQCPPHFPARQGVLA